MSPLERHTTYVAYLKMKVEEADWHGVSDAANDLRELESSEAYLSALPAHARAGKAVLRQGPQGD